MAAADVVTLTLHTADGAPTGDTASCVDPAAGRSRPAWGRSSDAMTRRSSSTSRRAGPCSSASPTPRARPQLGRPPSPTGKGARAWPRSPGTTASGSSTTRARSWTLLPAPEPSVQVTAVDDADANLLALTRDGRVLVLDGETGAERAASAPLVAESLATGASATLVADQQRAYLNGPVEGRLWEIDFADAARVAREFPAERSPRSSFRRDV